MKKILIALFLSLTFLNFSDAAPGTYTPVIVDDYYELNQNEKELIKNKVEKYILFLFKNRSSRYDKYKKIISLLKDKLKVENLALKTKHLIWYTLFEFERQYQYYSDNDRDWYKLINNYYLLISDKKYDEAYSLKYNPNLTLSEFKKMYNDVDYVMLDYFLMEQLDVFKFYVELNVFSDNPEAYEVKMQIIDWKVKTIYSKKFSPKRWLINRIDIRNGNEKIFIPNNYCSDITHLLPNEYFIYENNNYWIKLKLPYNKDWGNPYYNLSKYDEIPLNDIKTSSDKFNIWKIIFWITYWEVDREFWEWDGCYSMIEFLYILEKKTKDDILKDYTKPTTYGDIKSIIVDNKDIILFNNWYWGWWDSWFVVIWKKYNYLFYKSWRVTDYTEKEIKEIVKSIEFID